MPGDKQSDMVTNMIQETGSSPVLKMMVNTIIVLQNTLSHNDSYVMHRKHTLEAGFNPPINII